MKNTILLCFLLLLCFALAGCATSVSQQEYSTLLAERDALQLRLTEKMGEVEQQADALAAALNENKQLKASLAIAQAATKPTPSVSANKDKETATSDSTIVYVTGSGTKYHVADCRFIQKNKSEITLSKAIAQGYTPCGSCNPPQPPQ